MWYFNLCCACLLTKVIGSSPNNYDMFAVKGCVLESELAKGGTDPVSIKEQKSTNKITESLTSAVEILKTPVINTSKSTLTQLQELAQYNNIQQKYIFIGEEGPPHGKIFKVQLKLGNEMYEAEGASKKKARQTAALYALQRTNYKHRPSLKNVELESLLTPTVQLNNIAQHLALAVSYQEVKDFLKYHTQHAGKPRSVLLRLNHTYDNLTVEEAEDKTHPFIVEVAVGEKTYYGIGDTKQSAKHDAAKSALEAMKREALSEQNVCEKEGSEEECSKKRIALKSPISKVYELGQKLKIDAEFKIVEEKGRDHEKTFVMEGKLGDITVQAEGKSKKETKKLAAERILERVDELPEVSDEDYTVILRSKVRRKNKKKKKSGQKNVFSDGYETKASSVLSSLRNYIPDFTILNDDGTPTEKSKKTDNSQGNTGNIKSDLLHLTNSYSLQVEYEDLGKDDNQYYTKLSLDTKPRYVCFGKGESSSDAHEAAAMRAIGLLKKMGFVVHKQNGKEEDSESSEDLTWLLEKKEFLESEHKI